MRVFEEQDFGPKDISFFWLFQLRRYNTHWVMRPIHIENNAFQKSFQNSIQEIPDFPIGAFHKLRLHLGWVGGQKNV